MVKQTNYLKVYNYLRKYRSINRRSAMNKLFVWNLPDVIMVLRRMGCEIETVLREGKNYCDYKMSRPGPVRVVRYEKTESLIKRG